MIDRPVPLPYSASVELFFVRHAQSENNILEGSSDYLSRRRHDPPVTEIGQQQIDALATWIAQHDEPTRVYSSLHRRALQTGAAIAEALGRPHHGLVEVHESGGIVDYDVEKQSFVGAPGMSHDELSRDFPKLVIPDNAHPTGWWQSRGFESRDEIAPRAQEALKLLQERHDGEGIVVVSHYVFYVYFMKTILALDHGGPHWFTLHNCACTRISIRRDRIVVQYMNRDDYLPRDLVTATPMPILS